MMDITAILHMHAELSLTAVFILMFLLDLFLPAPQRHWLRPMACILLTIQLLANLCPLYLSKATRQAIGTVSNSLIFCVINSSSTDDT